MKFEISVKFEIEPDEIEKVRDLISKLYSLYKDVVAPRHDDIGVHIEDNYGDDESEGSSD